jgi:hypothetical protein
MGGRRLTVYFDMIISKNTYFKPAVHSGKSVISNSFTMNQKFTGTISETTISLI